MNGLLFISHQTEQYDYFRSVEIALKGGCRQVQLRMKGASLKEVGDVARKVKALCDVYRAGLYIDDHVEVCKKIGATGVHLGKLDMPPSEARIFLGADYIIGGTANTFEDICELHKQGVDYIGLGPFRFTTTKKKLAPVLGFEKYRIIIRRCRENKIHLPVLAIGGITIRDIPDLFRTGVSGIALSSTILSAGEPIEETKKIVHLINQYKQWEI